MGFVIDILKSKRYKNMLELLKKPVSDMQ